MGDEFIYISTKLVTFPYVTAFVPTCISTNSRLDGNFFYQTSLYTVTVLLRL